MITKEKICNSVLFIKELNKKLVNFKNCIKIYVNYPFENKKQIPVKVKLESIKYKNEIVNFFEKNDVYYETSEIFKNTVYFYIKEDDDLIKNLFVNFNTQITYF